MSTIFLSLAILTLVGFKLYTNHLDKDGVDDSEEGLRQRMYLWLSTLSIFILLLKVSFTLEQPELVKPNPRAYGTWYFDGGEEISVPFHCNDDWFDDLHKRSDCRDSKRQYPIFAKRAS